MRGKGWTMFYRHRLVRAIAVMVVAFAWMRFALWVLPPGWGSPLSAIGGIWLFLIALGIISEED